MNEGMTKYWMVQALLRALTSQRERFTTSGQSRYAVSEYIGTGKNALRGIQAPLNPATLALNGCGFRKPPLSALLAATLLLNGEDSLGRCFEPVLRYRVTTGIRQTIGTLRDLLQRPLDITDTPVIDIM